MGHLSWRALSRPLLLAALLSGSLAVPQAHAQFTYSDTSMQYEWGPTYTDPGSASRFDKMQLFFVHADGYKYGENYFNVDVLLSNNKDPTTDTPNNGSTEVFIVDRHDISGNAVTGTEMFKFGNVVRDLRLEFGGNLGTQDTQFGESLKALVIGPSIALNPPGGDGFWNMAFFMYKEWNSNGFGLGCGSVTAGTAFTPGGIGALGCNGTAVNFDPTFEFTTVWGVPIHVFGTKFKFEGIVDVKLPKGKDGSGVQTVTELFSKAKLKYDIGNLVLQKEHLVEVGAGVQYWIDKFGNPDSGKNKLAGADEFSPYVEIALYF